MTLTAMPNNDQAAAVAAAKGIPSRPIVGPGGIRSLTPLTRPAPAPLIAQPPAGAIEAMLTAAEASPQQRLQAKAARIRQSITELSGLVVIEVETREAATRVQKLRDELAAAETELRTLRNPATTSRPSTATPPPPVEVTRAVRAWAKTNNIPVSPHGRVSAELVTRWENATGGLR